MLVRFALLAISIPVALCSSDTVPLITWSSVGSFVLNRLHAPRTLQTAQLINNILSADAVCRYDAVVVIQHPGLRASDLRALSPTTELARTLRSAPSSRQYPYVGSSHSPLEPLASLDDVAELISQKCKLGRINITLDCSDDWMQADLKYFVSIRMPLLSGGAQERQELMADHELRLSGKVQAIASAFPRHLVVYTGSSYHQPMSNQKRSPLFTSSPQRGILHRYQLLTPALIICLLLTCFLLIPVIFVGISALASIQSTLRVEAPKGYSASEKKNL